MKPVFQFREGCHLRGDAQAVGERLECIRETQRTLTADLVLSDARAKRSPLHPYFEWDDGLAAEKYRLDQAGHLIRSVAVIFEPDEPQVAQQIQLAGVQAVQAPAARAVRAFLPIEDVDGDRSYVSTQQAMSDPDMRRQILARAHGELDQVARKWRELRDLGEVFSALERVGALLHIDEGQQA